MLLLQHMVKTKQKTIHIHFFEQLELKARRDGLRKISLRQAEREIDQMQRAVRGKYHAVSVSTLSRMTRGMPVTLETLGVLCNYLGCQPGDLLKLE